MDSPIGSNVEIRHDHGFNDTFYHKSDFTDCGLSRDQPPMVELEFNLFVSNFELFKCRPENNYSDSVCRQCCDTDNCTKAPTWWYPQSRAEWDYSGEEAAYPAGY